MPPRGNRRITERPSPLNVTSTGPLRCSTIRQSDSPPKVASNGRSRCTDAKVDDQPNPSLVAAMSARTRCSTPWVSLALKIRLPVMVRPRHSRWWLQGVEQP